MKKKDLLRLSAQYPKFVEWSEEDDCFIGRCPDLFDGGVHGRDEVAVYQKLLQAVEEWIVLLHEDGVALPKGSSTSQYSGKFVVRVAPTVHHRLALKAKASGESLNSFVAKSLLRA